MSDHASRVERAKAAGFSDADIETMLKFTDIMCGLTVKQYLCGLVEHVYAADKRVSSTKYKTLRGKLAKISNCKYVGSQTCQFKDNDSKIYTLCFKMGVVESDFERVINVPPMSGHENVLREIISTLDKLTTMAVDFYKAAIAQGGLMDDLAEFFPDIDVGTLSVGAHDRFACIDPSYSKRIGVLTYYIDENGKPCNPVE